MKTQIKDINIHDYSNYSNVIITDETGTEFELNFPLNPSDAQIKKTWINETCWRII